MQTQITTELLKNLNASNSIIEYFKNTFQDGITIQEMINQKCEYQAWFFATFKLTGTARAWNKNGQLRYEYNYKNGIR